MGMDKPLQSFWVRAPPVSLVDRALRDVKCLLSFSSAQESPAFYEQGFSSCTPGFLQAGWKAIEDQDFPAMKGETPQGFYTARSSWAVKHKDTYLFF